METLADFILLGSKITVGYDGSHEIKILVPWKKSYDKPRQHIKKQRHHFSHKGSSSQSYGFSSIHDVSVGPQRRLSTKVLMLLNYGAGEDSRESLGLQGDQTSQS